MLSLKSTKEQESKLHGQLYENIYLLTLARPPSSDFNAVFKRDMFVKNNKAAFHQVVYYLLHVLNPEKTKATITSWPIYEIRMETQFRNEIMKYLNELNTLYEDANIPNIMTSHLICPGGLKFVKFMLKLSQLVLSEHLKDTEEFPEMLLRIKPGRNKEGSQRTVKQLKAITEVINEGTRELKREFDETFQGYKTEADSILASLNRLNVVLPELRTKLAQLSSLRDDFVVDPEDYSAKLAAIQSRITQIADTKDKFGNAHELVDYLLSERSSLTYRPGNFKVPQEVTHVINENANNLSLIRLVEGFIVYFKRRLFEVRTINAREIEQHYELHGKAHEDLVVLSKKFDDLKKGFNVLEASLLKYGGEKRQGKIIAGSDSLDSTLATPLQDSNLVYLF